MKLRMLLEAQTIDLGAVAEVIRGDIGLTLELLRMGRRELGNSTSDMLRVAETVVHMGAPALKALVNETPLLTTHPRGKSGFRTCNRFWMHARLTALIAEQLATRCPEVNAEEAYTAGLLRHLGALPFVLGWSAPEFEQADPGECAFFIGRSWELPEILVEIVHGNQELCTSPGSLALLDLVNTADKHAFRLELGCDF